MHMKNEEMEKVVWRHENKYVCLEMQMAEIQSRISTMCSLDRHTGEKDRYLVRSLYFDDIHDSAYYENEMGTDLHKKYRIRLYNGSSERLTLERKTKQKGMTRKESAPFPRDFCEEILEDGWLCQDLNEYPPLVRQFYLEYRMKFLRPKVIVEYERIPYVYDTGNVRITFDLHISSSGNVGSFLESSLATRPIMPTGQHIMEIKYDNLIPDFVHNAISGEKMRQTAYSKYYLCRNYCEGV